MRLISFVLMALFLFVSVGCGKPKSAQQDTEDRWFEGGVDDSFTELDGVDFGTATQRTRR